MIKKIIIENIKGFGTQDSNGKFELDIFPNKPNIFVAPNGFGKSSFARAFKSLKKTKIDLHKDDYYQGDEANVPSIKLSYIDDDKNMHLLEATNSKNEINNEFDWFVINNQVFAKVTPHKVNGHHTASASLETLPIILSSSIPERIIFDYSVTDQRKRIGINGKILPNIQDLYKNKKLIQNLKNYYTFLQRISGSRVQDKIGNFLSRLNQQSGTKDHLISWIEENEIGYLSEINNLCDIALFLEKCDLGFSTQAENYLAALQISRDYNSDKEKFKQAVNRIVYETEKEEYELIFQDFNSSWKDFKPQEKEGKLIVEIPKVQHISNGQRDVMCFIALLKKAEMSLTKTRNILVVDEVFDYLDEANLIAVQYYITQLIEKFKKDDKEFYPIILTHLDPLYFKNFTFSKQKVFYLKNTDAHINESLKKLLLMRDDRAIEQTIKDNISKYYLHYQPSPIKIRLEFKPTWGDSENFNSYVFSQFDIYCQNNSEYDPFAVCCAVRKKVEQYAYERLHDPSFKDEFLSTHKTANKLKVAEDHTVMIPESFYLLGIIYNESMHWKENHEVRIAGKLENLTIKKMIKEINNYLES